MEPANLLTALSRSNHCVLSKYKIVSKDEMYKLNDYKYLKEYYALCLFSNEGLELFKSLLDNQLQIEFRTNIINTTEEDNTILFHFYQNTIFASIIILLHYYHNNELAIQYTNKLMDEFKNHKINYYISNNNYIRDSSEIPLCIYNILKDWHYYKFNLKNSVNIKETNELPFFQYYNIN